MSCQDSEESFEEVSAHGGSADEGVEEEEEEEESLVFEDDDEEEVAENESDDFSYGPALADNENDEEDDEKEPVFQQVVHLELPDGFWQSTSSGEDASPPAHQESSVVFAEDAPASVSQASSSFVMAPPAAAKSNSARDVDSFTAWSHVQEPSVLTKASASLATAAADGSTTTTTQGDWTAPTYFSNLNNNNNDAFACPSSASSVVSGFDCIDVDGFTMRQCHLDGYVNEEGAVWCLGCGAALVANPCPEMDHQIALNLQNKEEKDALAAVLDAEQERDNLRNCPVLQQAQAFVEQIQTSLDTACGRLGGGILLGGSRGRRQLSPTIGSTSVVQQYHKVPPVDQIMAAVQFLERAKTLGGEPAFLGYVYGSQHPHRILAMQKGESASSRIHILSDPLEAFQYWAEYELPYETAQPLLAVHEDEQEEEEGQPENHVVPMNPECCVGWIVAVAPGRVGLGHYRSQPVKRSKKEDNNNAGDDKDKTKKEEGSDKYNLTTIHAPHNTAAGVFLPLARFEASSRTNPETARLFQNLERTCLDFLDCVKIPAMTAAANDAVAEALLPATTTTDNAATSVVVDATAASTDAANPAVAAATQPLVTENQSSIQTPVVAEPNTVATATTTNRSVLHHALEAAEPSYAATTNIAASDHHHQAPSFSFNEPRTDVTVEGCEMRYCALCDELVLKWLPCPRGCDSSPEPVPPGKKMPPPSQSQQRQDHNSDEALPLPNASDDISTTAVAPVLEDEILHATEETKEDLPPQWAQWLREALLKPNRDDISTTAVAPAEAETRRTNAAVHVVLVSEEEERSHTTTTTGNFLDEWDRDGGIEMSDSLYNVAADPDPLSNVDGGHFSQQQQQQLNNLLDDGEQQSRGHAHQAQDDSQEEEETESEFHDERTVASWSTTTSTAENVVTTQPRQEFEFATIPRSANEDEPVHKTSQLFRLWGRRRG